jgi:hypothetical protein
VYLFSYLNSIVWIEPQKIKIIEASKTKEKMDLQGIFILQVLCQCYSFDIELPFFCEFIKINNLEPESKPLKGVYASCWKFYKEYEKGRFFFCFLFFFSNFWYKNFGESFPQKMQN